jgi:hypothetical protein
MTSATFTYTAAGQYQISYDYGIYASEAIIAAVFNDPEEDVLISSGEQGGGTGSEDGSGSFSIQVGSVPEASTWAMLFIGFVGIASARSRIQQPVQRPCTTTRGGGLIVRFPPPV